MTTQCGRRGNSASVLPRSTRRRLSPRQTARSRAAAARHRLAPADARGRTAVGRGSRQLQQRPDAHRLHHDQAQFCAARGTAAAADRAREGDAGGAGRGTEESREPAADLHRNRHRADGRQSRVLRNRRGIGVSDVTDKALLAEFKQANDAVIAALARLQEVAAGRSVEAIERKLRHSAKRRIAGSLLPTR